MRKRRTFPNRAAQRAASRRVHKSAAEIASRAFSAAFDEMLVVAGREGAPRSTLDFLRLFHRTMETRLNCYPHILPRNKCGGAS